MAVLWLQVSEKLPRGSPQVPQPGALEAYLGNIMVWCSPKVCQRFWKGSSTWRLKGIPWQYYGLAKLSFPKVSKRFIKDPSTCCPKDILWQYYGVGFCTSFRKVPPSSLNLAPQGHSLAILWYRVSYEFPKGFSKTLQPGHIMALGFPEVSQSFFKGASTWHLISEASFGNIVV